MVGLRKGMVQSYTTHHASMLCSVCIWEILHYACHLQHCHYGIAWSFCSVPSIMRRMLGLTLRLSSRE